MPPPTPPLAGLPGPRRIVVPRRRLLLVLLLLSGIWYQLRTHSPRAASPAPDGGRGASVVFVSTARDLSADEAAGGHTLARHVGQGDAALAQRLAREPSLAAASSFDDRATAERTVAAALAAERDRVDVWLRRGHGATFALSWRDGAAPVGRLLERGATTSERVHGARVVLRRHGAAFFVLTAYPERSR